MKRASNPHPWSVWVNKLRVATTRSMIDAALLAVLHGKGTRVRFAGWVVGTVPSDYADPNQFATEIHTNAAIKQSNALQRLRRVPAETGQERRSA